VLPSLVEVATSAANILSRSTTRGVSLRAAKPRLRWRVRTRWVAPHGVSGALVKSFPNRAEPIASINSTIVSFCFWNGLLCFLYAFEGLSDTFSKVVQAAFHAFASVSFAISSVDGRNSLALVVFLNHPNMMCPLLSRADHVPNNSGVNHSGSFVS
jgi:hypothetical protein